MANLGIPSEAEMVAAALETAEHYPQNYHLSAECMSRMEQEALTLLAENEIKLGADRINLIGLLTILTASAALAEKTRHAIELALARSDVPIANQVEWMRAAQVTAAAIALRAKVRNFSVRCA